MADPATPAPTPNDDPATAESEATSDAVQRTPVDLQWRPVWRGDEPDEVDQLLAPPR